MIQTVLLDIDGTLIDSNDAHAKAWVEALADAGFKVDFFEMRKRIGMGGDHILPEVTELSAESAKGKKIKKRQSEIFREMHLPHLQAFPGVRELLQKMRDHGLEIIIATSASKKDLQALLEKIGIEDLIEKTTSSDEAEHSKPDPDIISAALSLTRSNPQEAVMIGDTPYDIEAAAKAGVRTIAFTCGGWSVEALQEAISIYQSPQELADEFESSALCGNLTKHISPASWSHIANTNP